MKRVFVVFAIILGAVSTTLVTCYTRALPSVKPSTEAFSPTPSIVLDGMTFLEVRKILGEPAERWSTAIPIAHRDRPEGAIWNIGQFRLAVFFDEKCRVNGHEIT